MNKSSPFNFRMDSGSEKDLSFRRFWIPIIFGSFLITPFLTDIFKHGFSIDGDQVYRVGWLLFFGVANANYFWDYLYSHHGTSQYGESGMDAGAR